MPTSSTSPAYVLDTNSFHVMGNYYPDTFPTFWEHVEDLVSVARLTSVREVGKELSLQNTTAHLAGWVAAHSGLFAPPTQVEMQHVATIFAISHFQQLIGEKQRLRGQPVADPWLVARAMAANAIVVSEEAPKPNSAKVPNVCRHFGVQCVTVQEMLRVEAWRF